MAWFAGFEPATDWLNEETPNSRRVRDPFSSLRGYGPDEDVAAVRLWDLVNARSVTTLAEHIDSRRSLRRHDHALRTFVAVSVHVASRGDVIWAGLNLSEADGFQRIAAALQSVLAPQNAPAFLRFSEWVDPWMPDREPAARVLKRLATYAQEIASLVPARQVWERKGTLAIERNGEAAIETLAALWSHIMRRPASPKEDGPFNRACLRLLRRFPGAPQDQSGAGLETLIRRVLRPQRDRAGTGRGIARR